jgi:hypothetical protein
VFSNHFPATTQSQQQQQQHQVLRSELPRFGLWSLESQRIAFAQYAKAQAASAEKEEKIWADFLKSNGADQEEMQALGQKILASSIYGPNAEPVFPTYEGFEGFVTPSPGIPTPTPSSDVSTKDDDTKDDDEEIDEPESPARPPRPSRNKRNSTDEEIAVATPVEEKSRKPSVEGDSGMFFNPEEDGGGDDDEEDDGDVVDADDDVDNDVDNDVDDVDDDDDGNFDGSGDNGDGYGGGGDGN